MGVDVFTYVINIYVEYVSNNGEVLSAEMKLFLYAGVPLISVLALTGVTIWIVLESLEVVLDPPEDSSVDVGFMFGFAAFNLLIDIISVMLFYRNYDTALYQPTVSNRSTSFAAVFHTPSKHSLSRVSSDERRLSQVDESSYRKSSLEGSTPALEAARGEQNDEEPVEYNLNMWSAASHVSADTLRTFAVFAGALASSLGVNSDLSDAWAALICSVTIVFALFPLCKEIGVAIVKYTSSENVEIQKALLNVDEEA